MSVVEDLKQYDFVTNMNIGQLLPKKWGLQIFNYGQSETLITPEYDQQYKDLKLQNRLMLQKQMKNAIVFVCSRRIIQNEKASIL